MSQPQTYAVMTLRSGENIKETTLVVPATVTVEEYLGILFGDELEYVLTGMIQHSAASNTTMVHIGCIEAVEGVVVKAKYNFFVEAFYFNR